MADSRTAADKIESARIRAWAQRHGWPELGAAGRIPRAARDAWARRGGDDGQDPGPDDTDEPGDTDDLEDAGGADLEPPGSLEDARARAGLDPDAAHLGSWGRRRGGITAAARRQEQDTTPVKVTAAVKKDMAGKLAFWLSIPAEPWIRVDPYCGKAYADSFDQIALKATPLMCQSPAVVRWFAKSTNFVLVTELLMACRPVGEAMIAHHVTKRITLDRQGQALAQANAGIDFGPYSRRAPNPDAKAPVAA